ncbi:MAG: hypothetical protein RLZZ15_1978 [Verrucomicrobiota bacterium]
MEHEPAARDVLGPGSAARRPIAIAAAGRAFFLRRAAGRTLIAGLAARPAGAGGRALAELARDGARQALLRALAAVEVRMKMKNSPPCAAAAARNTLARPAASRAVWQSRATPSAIV